MIVEYPADWNGDQPEHCKIGDILLCYECKNTFTKKATKQQTCGRKKCKYDRSNRLYHERPEVRERRLSHNRDKYMKEKNQYSILLDAFVNKTNKAVRLCLKCDKPFASEDTTKNRLCPRCKESNSRQDSMFEGLE